MTAAKDESGPCDTCGEPANRRLLYYTRPLPGTCWAVYCSIACKEADATFQPRVDAQHRPSIL